MLRNFLPWKILALLAIGFVSSSTVSAQGPSGDWFADRMDSNRDGEIDENEASRLPGPMREALERERLRFPISKSQFAEVAPRMMEEMRRSGSFGRPPGGGPPGRGGDDRGGFSRGGDDRGRGDDDRGRGGWGDRGSYGRGGDDDDDRGRSGYSRGGPSWGGSSRGSWGDRGSSDRGRDSGRRGDSSKEEEKRPRVTVDLAESYAEADTDGDGQIGLYEWRNWKPTELNQFFLADANRDSFLTPRELEIFEKFPVSEADAATMAANFLATPTTSPTPPTARPSGDPKDKPSAKEAQYVFKVLDRDHDGNITEAEWQSSNKTRASFADAGIKVPLPATIDSFLGVYPYERMFPHLPIR